MATDPSAFRGVINFFSDIGMYDVVLPFLLVFTIVFAILDKTRVFGTETIEGHKYPKKNINAMVAFSIAFFVIASSKLVEVITKVSANVVVLLLSVVFFLTLVGSFMKETEDGVALDAAWHTPMMIALLLGIILIFLDALDWLNTGYEFLSAHWSDETVASLILIGTIVGVMFFITRSPGHSKPAEKKEGS